MALPSADAAPLPDDEALRLADAPAADLGARAAALRDAFWGRRVTYSPKVFLPLTNLCRNRCSYCSFRRSPGDPGAWTMAPAEVAEWLARGRAQGCAEALFCLGDRPESAFRSYRETLARWGHASTIDHLAAAAEEALGHGLLPHTNAGLLDGEEMERLRPVNVSLGLMLESASERLCAPGMPHHAAPDKHPARRLAMIDEAGRERAQSLLEIQRLHRAHGHIQEVIVQNFRAHPGTAMAVSPEPDGEEVVHAVAMARLLLDPEVSVQCPPNLNPGGVAALLRAGINDFGGISPVTPDYINPGHAWPHVAQLRRECAREGFELVPRLAVHEAFIGRPGFLDERLRGPVAAARARLEAAGVP
jgi:FO synthase